MSTRLSVSRRGGSIFLGRCSNSIRSLFDSFLPGFIPLLRYLYILNIGDGAVVHKLDSRYMHGYMYGYL